MLFACRARFNWHDAFPLASPSTRQVRPRGIDPSGHLPGAGPARWPGTLDRTCRGVLLCGVDAVVSGRTVVDGRTAKRPSLRMVLRGRSAAQSVWAGRALAMVPGLVVARTFADCAWPCSACQPAGRQIVGAADAASPRLAATSCNNGRRAGSDNFGNRSRTTINLSASYRYPGRAAAKTALPSIPHQPHHRSHVAASGAGKHALRRACR